MKYQLSHIFSFVAYLTISGSSYEHQPRHDNNIPYKAVWWVYRHIEQSLQILPRIENCGKKIYIYILNVIWKSMRPFSKCHKISKSLIERKLKILRAWWLISIFGTVGPKFEKVHISSVLLKLVSAIFYQIFIFSPNDSPLKTMKNDFHFI